MSDVAGEEPRLGLQVYKTPGITILGHEYRPGCCLVLEFKDDLPHFGIVSDIVILKDVKYFVVEYMDIEYFDPHIIAYVLKSTNMRGVVPYSKLFSKWPLSVHIHHGKKTVINKYSHMCDPL